MTGMTLPRHSMGLPAIYAAPLTPLAPPLAVLKAVPWVVSWGIDSSFTLQPVKDSPQRRRLPLRRRRRAPGRAHHSARVGEARPRRACDRRSGGEGPAPKASFSTFRTSGSPSPQPTTIRDLDWTPLGWIQVGGFVYETPFRRWCGMVWLIKSYRACSTIAAVWWQPVVFIEAYGD